MSLRTFIQPSMRIRSSALGCRRYLNSATDAGPDTSEQLRQVMRNVPQPVAIAVTSIPESSSSSTGYHGATLSSFTSLTLHPQPLVAFSLRLPSRLADYLRPSSTPSPSPSAPSSELSPTVTPDPLAASPIASIGKALSISLLASDHADIAVKLSKPGQDHSSIFSASPFSVPQPSADALALGTESTALPILPNAIGTMTCEVVSSTLLRDVFPTTPIDEDSIPFDEEVEGAGLRAQPEKQHDGGSHPFPPQPVHGSELFICRVLDVRHGSGSETPMVYYKHQYTTVKE